MADETVIELETRGAVLQVVEIRRAQRRAMVRVALGGIDRPEPVCMWVVMPVGERLPAVGAVVEFVDLEVRLVEVGGKVRPITRASGLREVRSDVAA